MLAPASRRVAPWLAETRQLWSLIDMIEFYGGSTVSGWLLLHESSQKLHLRALNEPEVPVPPEHKRYILHLVTELERECEGLGMENVALAARMLMNQVQDVYPVCNYGALHVGLDAFLSQLSFTFNKQRFAFVREDVNRFFERDAAFGVEVMQAVSDDINQEIRSAGNCLALDLHTASVFHCVRVVELGLRRFFSTNNIVIPKRPNLNDADWTEIITHLDVWLTAEIARLSTPSPARGSPERRRIDTYNSLISDARYPKERRNETMHCRHVFSASDARNVFDRVHAFMQRIVPLI
jgi:hypothetical protein